MLFFDNDAAILHLNWGQDGLMLSGVSNLMEDTDDWSFIRMRKSANSGNRNVTDLMVVDTSDVNLSAIGQFANECAIRTSNKTICTPINECVFGASEMPFTHLTHGRFVDGQVCVVISHCPGVELGIDVPHGFTGVVVNALFGVTEKCGRVRISQFAAEWFCLPRGCVQLRAGLSCAIANCTVSDT